MLPHPHMLLAMDGPALSSLLRAQDLDRRGVTGLPKVKNGESLLKRFEALRRDPEIRAGGWDHSPAVNARVHRLMSDLINQGLFATVPEFEDDLRAALEGEPDVRNRMNALGDWELMARICTVDGWWQASAAHCAEIEHASRQAVECLRQCDFTGLADEIQSNASLGSHFSNAALTVLRRTQSPEQALIVRAAGLCEFLLSQIARLSWVIVDQLGTDGASLEFSELLKPYDKDGRVLPGRAFMQFVMKETRAGHLSTLLSMADFRMQDADEPLPSETTLKRWHCGQVFPSERSLKALLSSLMQATTIAVNPDAFHRRVGGMYAIARRMDFLMRMIRDLPLPPDWPHRQTPMMVVLESTTVEDWITTGYSRWLAHWREPTTRDIKSAECG